MNAGQVEFSIMAVGLDDTLGKVRELDGLLNNLNAKNMGAFGRAVGKSTGAIVDQNKALSDYESLYQTRMRHIAQWGSRMQSLGGTIKRITSPFMNVFRGLTMGIGYRALGKVIEGITGSFERYDTMRTYAKVLNSLGMNANKKFRVGMGKARTAVDNLEQSVLGLPTGLDEMVASMRRYAGATGDVEKATKLAIAANNSYIAGQMDNRAKLFTERQLLSLAGGAELASTQWDSLRRNAPMAMRAVAQAMKMNVQPMVEKLKSGAITGQEFLKVFMEVGTEGKISKAAQKMKMTWDAVSQNISNAFHRMGSNVLEALDDVYKKTTGRDFLQTVLGVDKNGNAVGGGIKNFIDGLSESLQNFIRSNPTAVTDFFNNIMSIDWKGIAQGYADFAKFWGKIIVGAGKLLGGKTMIQMMLWGNIAGRAIMAVGGVVKGLAGIIAAISLHKFGNFIATIKGLFAGGLGMETTKNLIQIGAAGEAAATAAISWQSVASKAIIVAAIPAIAWSFKEAASALKELSGVKFTSDMAWNISSIVTAMTTMVAGAAGIGALLSSSKLAMFGTGVASAAFLAIGKAFELFGKGVKSISESVKIASETEIPSEKHLNDIIWAVGKIAKAFDAKNFGSIQKWVDSKSLQSQMKAIEQVADSFKSIKKLGNIKIGKGTLRKAKEHFKEIGTFVNDIGALFQVQEDKEMGYTTIGMGGRYNGKNGKGETITPWATLKQQIREFGETMESLSQGLLIIPDIMRNARNIQKVYKKITAENQETPLDWALVKDRVGSVADGLYGLLNGKKGSAWDKLNQVAQSAGQANLDNVINVMNKMPRLVNSIWRTFQNIKDSPLFGENNIEPIPVETMLGGTPQVSASPLYIFENKLGQVIDVVGRIQDKLANVDAESFNQDTSKINSALQFVKSAINTMQTLSTTGAETANNLDMSQFDMIGQKIADVIGKIKGQLVGSDKMMEGARNFNISLTRVGKAISKMKGLQFNAGELKGFGSVVSRIKKAIRQFNRIKPPKPKTINFKVNGNVDMGGLVGKINSKWQDVMTAWNKVESKTKNVTMKINGQVDTGWLSWDLASKIQAAIDGIKSYYTKNIVVHVNASAQVSGAGGMAGGASRLANAVRNFFTSRGGYIGKNKPLYRAMGGFAYMTPRGTDTVPAMLTPGEYVMRRGAVNTYGARFFQALNHMDLGRALNSISARAGQLIAPPSGTTINNSRTTNNTDNSNTTHNTYVTANGLGAASNFVNALR